MLVAKKLRRENIAEYLLYMWQVEDLLRANDLDIARIEQTIIKGYNQTDEASKEITDWYESLIEMMRLEGVKENGHLAINNNIIIELTDFHLQLLKSTQHADYVSCYYKTLPFIVELRTKTDNKDLPELETCFSALYGYLLMRLQKKEVSGETQAAIAQISNLLRLLASKYKQHETQDLEL